MYSFFTSCDLHQLATPKMILKGRPSFQVSEIGTPCQFSAMDGTVQNRVSCKVLMLFLLSLNKNKHYLESLISKFTNYWVAKKAGHQLNKHKKQYLVSFLELVHNNYNCQELGIGTTDAQNFTQLKLRIRHEQKERNRRKPP